MICKGITVPLELWTEGLLFLHWLRITELWFKNNTDWRNITELYCHHEEQHQSELKQSFYWPKRHKRIQADLNVDRTPSTSPWIRWASSVFRWAARCGHTDCSHPPNDIIWVIITFLIWKYSSIHELQKSIGRILMFMFEFCDFWAIAASAEIFQ